MHNRKEEVNTAWKEQGIQPLNLKELAAIRQAKNIGSEGVEPFVDIGYVLQFLERLSNKLEELISHTNSNRQSILDIEEKVNDVISTLNVTFRELDIKHNSGSEKK